MVIGEVAALALGEVRLVDGRALPADFVVKTVGWEPPDYSWLAQEIRPPIWVSPRIVCFRNEADLVPMEDYAAHAADMINLPFSATFSNDLWLELFLHFNARPVELRALLERISAAPLAFHLLDLSRGIHACLNPEVQAKVDALRVRFNHGFFDRYGGPCEWLQPFLEENRRGWEDLCSRLTGNPLAVPYIWQHLCRSCSGSNSGPQIGPKNTRSAMNAGSQALCAAGTG